MLPNGTKASLFACKLFDYCLIMRALLTRFKKKKKLLKKSKWFSFFLLFFSTHENINAQDRHSSWPSKEGLKIYEVFRLFISKLSQSINTQLAFMNTWRIFLLVKRWKRNLQLWIRDFKTRLSFNDLLKRKQPPEHLIWQPS